MQGFLVGWRYKFERSLKEEKLRILKNAGSFEIITPPGMSVRECLENELFIIEKVDRVYRRRPAKEGIVEIKKLIRQRLKLGHEAVIEHGRMIVLFNNISRGMTHEGVRHRLASFAQESTRYVDYSKEMECVVPPHRDENEKVELENGKRISVAEMLAEYEKFYRALRKKGWKPEDARQILPIGIKSSLVVNTNFRQWRHMFELRTAKAVHWEIRGVMDNLLDHVKPILSPVFDDFQEAGVDENGLRYFEKKEDFF